MTSLIGSQATPKPEGQTAEPAKGALPDAGQKKPTEGALPEGGKQGTAQPEPQNAQGDKQADAKGEKKPDGAPERYEFKPPKDFPEGQQIDPGVLEKFSTVAKELDLSQDRAQKLLDTMMPAIQERILEQQAQVHEEWVAAVKADKEIGGAALQENLATARRFVQAYGDKDLQALLDGPIGSHPALLRALVKAGRDVSPDRFRGPNGRQSVDADSTSEAARKLYPKSYAQ